MKKECYNPRKKSINNYNSKKANAKACGNTNIVQLLQWNTDNLDWN